MLERALRFAALGHRNVVPANFLPAALPVLLHGANGAGSIPVFAEDAEGGLRMRHLAPEVIADPDRLAACLETFGGGTDAPTFLGPPDGEVVRGGGLRSIPLPPGRHRRSGTSFAGAAVEVGVIDAGIAFWAPLFGTAFASMGFLDLNAGDGDPILVRTVPADDLAAMRARGGTAAGDRANRAKLAADHPGSVYATLAGVAPIVTPGRPSHGIAIASLVREAADLRLHGLDLPDAVLRDASGTALRSVLDVAIRGVANMAAAHHDPDRPLRVVIALAFGFLGGPQDRGAEADILQRLHRTIGAYRRIGIEITLVVPMGNHLQNRAHASLPVPGTDGRQVHLDWRLLPDDHSGNTVDLFHAEGIPALTLDTPDGRRGVRPAGTDAVHLFGGADGAFGATWTEPAGPGLSRTRISLGPTASRSSARALAPFGVWRLTLDCPAAEAWILRDDAAFDDRAAPRRRSWFEDPAYRARDRLGLPAAEDGPGPAGAVRRAGSASVLATSRDAGIVPVGAHWRPPAASGPVPARYSGAFAPGHPRDPDWVLVETRGPAGGRLTPGTASGRLFRISGTSVAAALHAGRLAASLTATA